MKHRSIYTSVIAAAGLLLMSGCSQEEGLTVSGTQPMTVEITDGGYVAEDGTRATENGYSTEFTAGDECGLYVMRNGTAVYENVKLTATEQNDSITWQPEASVTLAGGMSGESYYLYYPYQADMTGKVTASVTTDEAFFATLISGWTPKDDQTAYADYTASDLMTAKGTAASADGKVKLSFSMTHRMALAVIELPKVSYRTPDETGDYTATTGDFSDSSYKPYLMADGTYRYITNPNTTGNVIKGSYNGNKFFNIKLLGSKSRYKTYKVDGGSTATSAQLYIPQIGDFLMTDGSLLNKYTTLTEEQKKNVSAIVFWTPAETDPTGRNTPASLADDKIMVADFPNCIHGLAVALKDASDDIVWQIYDTLNDMREYQVSHFTHEHKELFASISSGASGDNINKILGYQNSLILYAYNKGQQYDSWKAGPAEAVRNYSRKAPAGSTGWFLPSLKVLHMLCYKDVDDVNSARSETYTETRDKVNPSLSAAGGDLLGDNIGYWSSTEDANNWKYQFCVIFKNAAVESELKFNRHRSRAVCAF